MSSDPPSRDEHPLWSFATRVLIAVAIAAAAYLAWQMRFAMLTAFAAVLVAVLLLALTGLLRKVLPIRQGWALGVTVILIVVLLAAAGWLVGSRVQGQFNELLQKLPEASQTLEQRLGMEQTALAEPQAGQPATAAQGAAGGLPAPGPAPGPVPGPASAPAPASGSEPGSEPGSASGPPSGTEAVEQILGAAAGASSTGGTGLYGAVLSQMTSWLTAYGLTIVDAFLGIVLVVIAGVYLAIDPAFYRSGTVKLFPRSQHRVVGEALLQTGESLRLYLFGKFISMAIIGALVGVGTWLLGLPTPLALGIFAGLVEFVPIIGPIIGAIPALLLAATIDFSMVLWTLLLFLGIQQIESNMIAPNIEGRMVTIPPALYVLGVGIFGGLFGLLGVILSGPLLVVSYVLVKKLWMREALHESTPMPTDEDAGR